MKGRLRRRGRDYVRIQYSELMNESINDKGRYRAARAANNNHI